MLIVWDTVRASYTSLHGYPRDTTPNLSAWARKGVRFDRAVAPAPWTFPSHCSFFTGQWPFRNNSQWKYTLDASHPTLAEYLRSRGYQTAGFVANTECCNYETGLDRGFAHYEDYPLTPRSLLGRTVAGEWILKNLLSFGDYYDQKWIGLQSRGAREINDAFLDWLDRRRADRPFFAFLNDFDAHAPYIAPPGHQGRFGIRPGTAGRLPGPPRFHDDGQEPDHRSGTSGWPATVTTTASPSSTTSSVACSTSCNGGGSSRTRT